MSLRNRLFLWVGALFLVLTLLSYFFPRVIVRKEVHELQHSFGQEMQKDRLALYQERDRFFSERIKVMQDALIASSNYLQDAPTVQEGLDPFKNSDKELWEHAFEFLTYAPHLQAIQVHAKDKPAVVIALENARLYPTKAYTISDHLMFVSFESSTEAVFPPIGPYLGVRVRDDQTPASFLYYLYTIDTFFDLTPAQETQFFNKEWALLEGELTEQIQTLEKSLAQVASLPALINWLQQKVKKEPPKKQMAPAVVVKGQSFEEQPERDARATFFNGVRLFVQMVISSMKASPTEPEAPIGIISFLGESLAQVQTNKWAFGLALLSQEVFFDTPVLDHIQGGLVVNPLLNDFLLAKKNDFKTEEGNFTVTLGASLVTTAIELATGVEQVVFVEPNGQLHMVMDGTGAVQSPELFRNINFLELFPQQYGQVTLDEQPYYFVQATSLLVPDLHIFIFKADAAEVINTLKAIVGKKLSESYLAFSYQLMLVAVFILIGAWILLAILTNRITKPIVTLAHATDKIAEGDYAHVELPALPDRLDEVSSLYENFGRMLVGLRDKERVRSVLDRMVSREIAAEILKGTLQLGGEDKEVTIFFSDIRQFTKRSEHLSPQELIGQLNEFMTRMTRIIEGQGGVIDKYVGDEIMALYGAPVPCTDGPRRAIVTGLLMLRALHEWNQERQEQQAFPFEIGIGIHTGRVVAGNMGSESRLNYTVLGANVNLTARLCAAAGPMQIITTKETLDASGLKEKLDYEELSPAYFKGFSEPIVTYWIKGWRL